MSLLTDDSRLVRSRSLDIFSILLESTPYPLGILGSDKNSSSMDVDRSEDEALVECKNPTARRCLKMLETNDIHTPSSDLDHRLQLSARA